LVEAGGGRGDSINLQGEERSVGAGDVALDMRDEGDPHFRCEEEGRPGILIPVEDMKSRVSSFQVVPLLSGAGTLGHFR